jgi:hypothetical protein
MFRTGWYIIRRIKCLITRAASGTVPSVVVVWWGGGGGGVGGGDTGPPPHLPPALVGVGRPRPPPKHNND